MSPDDDKPFACNAIGCGMRFTNEDHLTVHKRKHEMSLALNSGSSMKANATCTLFVADQTPTPTKFLRNCDEIGLFHELNKNPFEEAFKKATDSLSAGGHDPPLPGPSLDTPTHTLDTPAIIHQLQKHFHLPLPGPSLDTPTHILDTPTPALLRPLPRVESEDIPELSADNIITIPMTDSTTPVPDVPAITTSVSDDKVQERIIVKEEPMEMAPSPGFSEASPQPSIVDTPTPTAEVELLTSGASPAPTHASGVSPPIGTPSSQSPSFPVSALSPAVLKGNQMATVQVLIQLQGGQTISIPATLPGPAVLDQAKEATGSDVTVTTATSSSALTKQKLKAALSQNTQQSILNSNMMVMSEAVERVTSMSSRINDAVPVSIPTIVATASPSNFSASACALPDSSTVPNKRARLSVSDLDTDDRRKKFLERNRAAAARCRYKRKAWINGLEKKSDDLATTNAKLLSEITILRTEIAQLKSLLLAHKNCPVTLRQKQQGQLSLVEELDGASGTTSSVAAASTAVTVINTVAPPTATALTALKQVQSKGAPITMVAAKNATQALSVSPVPVTFLQNHLPVSIASATGAIAGTENPTYIIVTNQPDPVDRS